MTKTLTRLRPTFDRILIERVPETGVSKGGIVIPDQSISKPAQGYIRDMGPLVHNRTSEADIFGADAIPYQAFDLGDKVQIGQYAGTDMVVDDVAFVLVKEDEIMTIITETTVEVEGHQVVG